jgi:hypothetical protein
MKTERLFLACLVLLCSASALAAEVNLRDRWVYCSRNLLVDGNVDAVIALMERAKKSGCTGLLLADYKFNILDRMDERYFRNARRVIAKAKDLGLEIIPAIFPIGYASGVLAHDPNLIEGLPVVDAPFEVRTGRLVPLMDDDTKLVNGDFEDVRDGRFAGWWQENVGQSVFADSSVVRHGRTSLRMENIAAAEPRHGHCRVNQVIKTRPFREYHLSVWIKTENLDNAGDVRLAVLAKRPETLSHKELGLKRTQDWTEHHVVFNTLENTEVRVYCGVWGGKSGKLWWDDLRMEPAGFVNVIRRDACPVRLTSPDGRTVYAEGRDVARIVDAKLGNETYAGTFAPWHTPPVIETPQGSRLKNGDRVLASCYHPMIIHDSQVTCSLTDPKVYEILDDQMRRVHELFGARTYMMSHDEIRVGGWTPDYAGMTMGEALAANVRKCAAIVRKHAPRARICVWSDMFDPNHNARSDYYLVRTTWAGSWEGLPKDIVVVDWHAGQAAKTMEFFAGRGLEQIIAGYYDGDVETNVRTWMDAANASKARITGVMYTTWRTNYDDLEKFFDAVRKREK